MGYLTTITIHNDALHSFEKDPEAFGKAVFEAIDKANMTGKAESAGFKGYVNYITAQPSRHADDTQVYVHKGNTVTNINPWCQDFRELSARCPDFLKNLIDIAADFAKGGKKELKEKV